MKRVLIAVGALGFLAACDNARFAQILAPETTVYDGVWVGQLSVVRRNIDCRLTRTGIRAKVEGGVIDGVVRYGSKRGQLVGVLNEDGTVRSLQMAGERSDLDDLDFEGAFTERDATGEWTHKDCNGEWALRKAR